MKILLTGANGFVGRHFQKAVACVPFLDHGSRIDIRDLASVRKAILSVRPDAVVHLAGQSFKPQSSADPFETYQVNFFGTFNLLLALKEAGFSGRMLYVSSGDVYGSIAPEDLPARELSAVKPRSAYAVSKAASEMLCYQWSLVEQFEIVTARPFNHVGPGQSERFALPAFAKQIAEIKKGLREPVLRVGDIDVMRDFTDVRDVVRAYVSLLRNGKNGEVYNVCSGVPVAVRDLLEKMMALSGVRARIEKDPSRLRKNEQSLMVGSYDKLNKDTGWKPEVDIDQSIADIMEYWFAQ